MKWSQVLMGVVTLVVALSFGATTAHARTYVGPGQKVNFSMGQSVTGASITFDSGRTWYECYMPRANRSGYVIGEGVIGYDPVEVKGKTPCASTKPNPGPRWVTGPSTFKVEAGHKVVAVIIEAVRGRGITHFQCFMTLPYKAYVTDGVVDPHPAEIASAKSCSQTTDWNPGRRMLTGDGKRLSFLKGDNVIGHQVYLSSKNVAYQDCYIKNAPSAGWVESGVVNYYPGEQSVGACIIN